MAEKGLDAFVTLADKLLGVADIILVGEDNGVPERANLKCIGFTSNVDELVELYSAADVLVNASSAETFGLVTVEAMACGTPVVAFDNSGSSEIVNAECGVLVKDGDLQSLVVGVTEVLENSKGKYSSACREYVCSSFEKNGQLLKYIDFYNRLYHN
jgi:glycosyltransferase involved in cell wall biosynthesis